MLHIYNKVDRKSFQKASRKYVNYFDSWLARLDISQELYKTLTEELVLLEYN